MVKISVVISTYNQIEFIGRTIQSIITQTEDDWELIIIGDGCTDGTNEYIKSFKSNPRIKVIIHDKRKGSSFRLNEGFGMAEGKYHTWISSDNVYYPSAFKEMIKGVKGCDGVYTNTHYIDKNDNILWTTTRPEYQYELLLVHMCYFVGVVFMYKSECFKELGGYSEKYLHSNDLDWWLKMGEKYKVKLITQILGAYRDHSADNRYDGNWEVGGRGLVDEAGLVIKEAMKRSGKNPLSDRHIECNSVDKIIRWK